MSEPARARQGRTPYGRTRHVVERLGAVLVSSGLLLSAAPAAVATAPTAATNYPATVVIDSVTPKASGQGDAIKITGRVTNTGGSPIKAAHAAVRGPNSGKRLENRVDLGLVATRGNPSRQDGIDLPNPQDQLGDLAAGQTHQFNLQVSPADLGISRSGVYELAVDVWSGPVEPDSHALGIARTYLPYNADPIPNATQIATLWPITHAPELVAQTMLYNDQIPVLRDDSLATELAAPNGRLYQLVHIGQGLPGLTWTVDPDLLDTVYAMTRPYRVQKPGTTGDSAKDDNTVPGTGQDAAKAWLAQLRQAVAVGGNQVVSLPYADPDLASIAHNGADLGGMDTTLRKAGTAGQVTAEGRLSADVRSGVAWPYQGAVDTSIAALARNAGDNLVLVNGASMPERGSLSYTPNAVRQIGNGQTAVVADQTISELFQGDLNTEQARTAARQRFLAETWVITNQLPNAQRSLLVMPPRGMTAGTAIALADAIQQAQGAWINEVKLDAVASAAPDNEANTNVPSPAEYPGGLRGSELSGSALAEVMDVQVRLDKLMRILTQPQRVRGPFSAAMVRSMSTAWRDQAGTGESYRAGVQSYLDSLISAVKVPAKSMVTLPGDKGTILVSVKNDLNQAVGNLELRLSSSQLNRLNVGAPESVVLDATTNVTLRFPAEAQVNGPVQMTAQLYTTGPNAQPYGKAVTFTVEVTSVTQGVLYVIGCGVVLILLAAGRFYLQRKKRATDPVLDEDAGDAEDAEGSEQDADPEDSEQESAEDAGDQVAGDEKVGH